MLTAYVLTERELHAMLRSIGIMQMQASKRAAIQLMIERYTKKKTMTRQTARAALIDEGIYTKKGKLSAKYGGSMAAKKVSSDR